MSSSMWMWSFVKILIYHTFIASLLKKNILWDENLQIKHMVFKHDSYYVKWHGSIYNFHNNYKSFKCSLEYICVFEYIGTLHSSQQIYSNLPLYKMKWNNLFSNILPRLYPNIICKNIVKIFWKLKVHSNMHIFEKQ